ncbi:4Fe-4S dicluster domain-containing protein [Helicobacter sp. MIT 21-1697]|uniref:4Fe-4S dicluster domain-containing protein n=1 Tax=Helicobacter sp. MIT 21-1697 TaxID=2993733 RepID=UPI00224B0EE1|nr:4Fe-4S dicluster domain-containing protein [Helicobacter sp. MIT 21-1697]MCX2717325.1 4Fe-4S dicluster domain-containing protein [Helicobacter sp. MIT 21-1697]
MKDTINEILSNEELEILQECNELTLDFTSFSKDILSIVTPHCVVIGYGELCDEFLALCVNEKHTALEVLHLLPQDFVRLSGHLGDFKLYFKNAQGEIDEITTSQVVSFAPLENLPHFKGVHTPNMYDSADSMLQVLLSLCGEQAYSRHIVFDPLHCQYQGRRTLPNGDNICHSCVDICPTMGVSSDDSLKILQLSPIDCIACGKCVSVCPTGSMQREGDGLEAFTYKARLYKGRIPLIIARSDFESPHFTHNFRALRKHNSLLLPFVLEVPDMLNSTYFLTLLQESSSSVVVYTPLGEHIHDEVESINTIYKRIFDKEAIFFYQEDALSCLDEIAPLTQSHYIYTPTSKESSKDIFAERMRFWIKQEEYGKVAIKGFGIVGIDAQNCTMCLSCVEACNTNALINNNSSFELLYKSSLCTDCGYCVASCAEKVLSIESHILNLIPQSFEYTKIAADEPFRCVECDKIFATRKSIEKIKGILAPAFGSDTLKLKTLECCADCKVKVMFEGAH